LTLISTPFLIGEDNADDLELELLLFALLGV
jgi:hypothetical protein